MDQNFDATAWSGLLLGLLALFAGIGALIYLTNPWVPADLFACVMKAVGGFLMLEALMVAGFCDIYVHFWLRNLGNLDRRWAWVTVVWGLVLAVPATLRFD
jgi:hypothetical protein